MLKASFTLDNIPPWPCPSCSRGVLNIVEGTFQEKERAHSVKAKECDAWDPEWIEALYSCLLRCSNSACGEFVASHGTGSLEWAQENDDLGEPQQVYITHFKPRYFYPPLRIFEVPPDTPESVVFELNAAFELAFCQPASSANRLRMALENILTYLGISRSRKNKQGKRSFTPLAIRIESIPDSKQAIKDLCTAVRWLGNAGSHPDDKITSDVVMDACEIMEKIIHDVFDSKGKRVRQLSRKIIANKGPIRSTRRKPCV